MKKYVFLFLISFLTFNCSALTVSESLNNTVVANESVQNRVTETEEDQSAEEGEEAEEEEANIIPLLFIILAIIIGSLTRFLFKKSPIPFTVVLLIIGIGLGALGRFDLLHSYTIGDRLIDISFFDEALNWAANINPHLLLYVFLPILIFEAAFAMDVHVFKKVAVNASILAIPGIIVAMLLTAGMIFAIYYLGWGLEGWNWQFAMLFGAVISATDPVAVVSILKELGASKKLGTLIEGESLLNDGTAIVIFMVILGGITGLGSDLSPILVFFKVSFGGILVGGVIGWLIIKWVKKVFNDMLVEISAIIGASYLTFFIAENFLGVSGVLALVTFGLMLASIGRTKISPEVQHFLHEFWELTAFLANVLIFLIVGVVIAERIEFTGNDMLMLLIVFVGVFIVRAIVIAMFYPFMKRIGYGVDGKDSMVMWWGALRGAIGLALALIVAGTESIPHGVRDQFLFLTAGVVTMTLLINATTMKLLVEKLGMLKVSPSKQVMMNNANEYIHQSTENALERLKKERYLKRSNWKKVKEYLPELQVVEIESNAELDFIQESRRRILEQEKSSYWKQFKDGLLEPDAYRVLVSEINGILDSKGSKSVSERKDIEKLLSVPKYITNQKSTFLSKFFERLFFNRMATSYDSARGFVSAQDDCLKLLQSMMRSTTNEGEVKELELLRKEIEENQIIGMTYLRNIGKEFPEIYSAISTRKSIRTVLNYEKHTIERLHKNGRITDDEAHHLIGLVEKRMKKLRDEKILSHLPSETDLVHEFSWLNGLFKEQEAIIKHAQIINFPIDEIIFKQGDAIDGFYILVRGNVEFSQNKQSVILSESSIIGEVGGMMSGMRKGTATAITPITMLFILAQDLKKMLNDKLTEQLWLEQGKNLANLYLREKEPYNRYSKSKLSKEIAKGRIVQLNQEELNLFNDTAILIEGELHGSMGEQTAPCLLSHTKYEAKEKSVIFVL